MKRIYELGSIIIVAAFIYGVVTADRAVEGGDLNTITKDKVVAVVKSDANKIKDTAIKVKEELKKIEPSEEFVYNQ